MFKFKKSLLRDPNDQEFWGYLHTNGTLIVKKFIEENDIKDALDSVFCDFVFRKILAPSAHTANYIFKEQLFKMGYKIDRVTNTYHK